LLGGNSSAQSHQRSGSNNIRETILLHNNLKPETIFAVSGPKKPDNPRLAERLSSGERLRESAEELSPPSERSSSAFSGSELTLLGLLDGVKIRVFPTLLSQGINETQTMANLGLSETTIQEEINSYGLQMLRVFFFSFSLNFILFIIILKSKKRHIIILFQNF